MSSRIERENKTAAVMISLYCRKHHSIDKLCSDCEQLKKYAAERLKKCPFQESKPTCGKCAVHCYKPDMRERIREVMRYSGPRMFFSHPIMAIQHFIDSRRKTPRRKSDKNRV